MALLVRTMGLTWAQVKIDMADLTYNFIRHNYLNPPGQLGHAASSATPHPELSKELPALV
jgi:hypothetical protein